MTTFLLATLILADLGLVFALFRVTKKQTTQSDILRDLTEERMLLTELRSSIKEELDLASRKSRDSVSKVAKLAAEAEHEVTNRSNSFATNISEIVTELTSTLESPLEEITKKQFALENLFKKIGKEKMSLVKAMDRAESLVEYFEKGASHKNILQEIEEKRYCDARALLAKGISASQVSIDVGLPESEIKLIEGIY